MSGFFDPSQLSIGKRIAFYTIATPVIVITIVGSAIGEGIGKLFYIQPLPVNLHFINDAVQ